MPTVIERIKNGWNAFVNNKDPTENLIRNSYWDFGSGSFSRPDRIRFASGNERTIVTAIFNRIAVDAAQVTVNHARLDQNGKYLETLDTSLNTALTLDANLDQTGRAFIQDAVASMLDEGCVALVPTDALRRREDYSLVDIEKLRTGKVLEWHPTYIKVRVYNERIGRKEDIFMPKDQVAIVENPLYAVINEPNSTMRRLIRKLSILDAIDEQSGAGKLDLIIQLPYVVKTDARRDQAEKRRKDIEMQLANSKYGIAYTDGTEHITQLNRSVDNNLMHQIEYLINLLYSQLGLTEEILNGTADEKAMNNYYNRTIEPIMAALCNEMTRKFLTKTARSQRQAIIYIQDPFRLTPVSQIAEIADKFTRNEILSSNEVRGIIGYKPVDDERANQLRNKNLNEQKDTPTPVTVNDSEDDSHIEQPSE